MPKSPTRPTQYPSPQGARELQRWKPRHSCRGGRPQSVLGSEVSPAQALADRLRDVLVLDERYPCLRHFSQCLGDVVGGHALRPEIQDHAFFIVPPKDAINEIIPTGP